jgi:beta-xylosidase
MNKSKLLFIFNIDNVIDIITNSSSELFTFKMDNGTVLYNLLQSFDSNFYKTFKPVSLRKSDASLFTNYVCTILPYRLDEEGKENIKLPEGITIEDIYSFDDDDQQWYMKSDYDEETDTDGSLFEKYRDILQEWLDPTDNVWLLYIDDYMMDSDLKEKVKQISTYERF